MRRRERKDSAQRRRYSSASIPSRRRRGDHGDAWVFTSIRSLRPVGCCRSYVLGMSGQSSPAPLAAVFSLMPAPVQSLTQRPTIVDREAGCTFPHPVPPTTDGATTWRAEQSHEATVFGKHVRRQHWRTLPIQPLITHSDPELLLDGELEVHDVDGGQQLQRRQLPRDAVHVDLPLPRHSLPRWMETNPNNHLNTVELTGLLR